MIIYVSEQCLLLLGERQSRKTPACETQLGAICKGIAIYKGTVAYANIYLMEGAGKKVKQRSESESRRRKGIVEMQGCYWHV